MVLKKAQDSAPRAADAARYARARKNATEAYVKGAGRRGPRFFGANIELIIMPTGACAELIALRCAVCLFMSHSERQYVCYLRGRGGGAWGPREDNQLKKGKRRVHNAYINLVPVSYLVLLLLYRYIQKNAQRAQHSTAKRRARRGTALRRAVLLSYIWPG